MIIELYEQHFFSIRTDMLLCPTVPSGLTDEAVELGFDRVHPEIATAVREASELNDMPAGVLMCLRAENSSQKELLVGVPMSPHSREPLSPYYLHLAIRSLRQLINEQGVKRVTIPINCFCELDKKEKNDDYHGIKSVTKYTLIKELMFLEASLYDDVEFILVH